MQNKLHRSSKTLPKNQHPHYLFFPLENKSWEKSSTRNDWEELEKIRISLEGLVRVRKDYEEFVMLGNVRKKWG